MDLQLSLFPSQKTEPTAKKQKQAKLGRYEKLQRQLLTSQRLKKIMAEPIFTLILTV